MELLCKIVRNSFSLRSALDIVQSISPSQRLDLLESVGSDRDAAAVISEAIRRSTSSSRDHSVANNSDLEILAYVLINARYDRTFLEAAAVTDSVEWMHLLKLLLYVENENALRTLDRLESALALQVGYTVIQPRDTALHNTFPQV